MYPDTCCNYYNDWVNFDYKIDSIAISKEYDLHCHACYEVYYYLEGEIDYMVEGHTYHLKPNSLLLLSPHIFHGVRLNSEKQYRRFTLHFHEQVLSLERKRFLLSLFQPGNFQPIYYMDGDLLPVLRAFESLQRYSMLEDDMKRKLLPIGIEALLAVILSLTCEHHTPPISCKRETIMDGLLLFINQHLLEPLTLDMLSDQFHLSKHHLNTLFKQATGTTIGDYTLHKRIIYAQKLLSEGYTASIAAMETGFTDYSSFYRSYKKYTNHSPFEDKEILPFTFTQLGD